MSSVFSIGSGNNYSFLFNNSSSKTSGLSSSLSDYNLIKSGAYGKLMRSYYNKTEAGKSAAKTAQTQNANSSKTAYELAKEEADSTTSTSDSTSTKNITNSKSTASSLKKAANSVSSLDTSDKTETASAVESLVNAYNSYISSADKVDDSSVLHKTMALTGSTGAAAKQLSSVGITVGSDNKLTLNKDTLAKASADDLNTFKSYASGVADTADKLESLSTNALSKKTNSLYNSYGSYSGLDYSTLFNSFG